MSLAHGLLLSTGDHERATPGALATLADDLAAVAARHGATSAHVGENLAPAEFTEGLTVGLVAQFPDGDALTAYLTDADHEALVARMTDLRVRAVVADLPPRPSTP